MKKLLMTIIILGSTFMVGAKPLPVEDKIYIQEKAKQIKEFKKVESTLKEALEDESKKTVTIDNSIYNEDYFENEASQDEAFKYDLNMMVSTYINKKDRPEYLYNVELDWEFRDDQTIKIVIEPLYASTKRYEDEIKDYIKEVVKECPDGSKMDKVRWAYDHTMETLSYDYLKSIHILSDNNTGSLYEAVTKKKTICTGYAYYLQALLDELGIQNRVVEGLIYKDSKKLSDGTIIGDDIGFHMWNMVKVNGDWYHLDATFGDDKSSKMQEDYFMKESFKDDRYYGKDLPLSEHTIPYRSDNLY